jgi:hypothetical protein
MGAASRPARRRGDGRLVKPSLSLLRALVFCALAYGSAGCDTSDYPVPLRTCPSGADGQPPSSGPIRVLPSGVAGLTLDSMRWDVREAWVDFGHQTTLDYRGRVVATRETPLWGVGVLYQWTKGSRPEYEHLGASFVFLKDSAGSGTLVEFHRARPERPAPIRDFRLAGGMRPPSSWGCPATARLIRIMDAPDYLGLTAAVARDSAERLAALRARASKGERLAILTDTLVRFPEDDGLTTPWLFAGVAVNLTGDTLHDAAVWYAIDFSAIRGGPDTVVYMLGTVAPHALAPFAGGPIEPGDDRSVHGAWVGAAGVAGLTEAFDHRLSRFRYRHGVPPSVVPEDELPPASAPKRRVFDPANLDLFGLAHEGHLLVAARVRAAAGGDSLSQLALIEPACCPATFATQILRYVRTGTPAQIDTATIPLTGDAAEQSVARIERSLRDAVAALQRRALPPSASANTDSGFATPAPGTELTVVSFSGWNPGIVLRYSIGRPPPEFAAALTLLDSLASFGKQRR